MFGFCKMHDVKVPSLRSGAVKLKKKGDVCIMKLSGKLDLYNVYKVKNLYSEIVSKGINSFVLDAGKMNYMDNSGFGVCFIWFLTLEAMAEKCLSAVLKVPLKVWSR